MARTSEPKKTARTPKTRTKKRANKEERQTRIEHLFPMFFLGLLFLILIVLLTLLFLLYRLYSLEKEVRTEMYTSTTTTTIPTPLLANFSEDEIRTLLANNAPMELGDPNAPLVITEFSDFQCPFCVKYHNEVFKTLREEYIDTGKVLYRFRHMPLYFHPFARPAANAALCTENTEQFWEMVEILFERPSEWTNDNYLERFATYATELDMENIDEYRTCIVEKSFEETIDQDVADGLTLEIEGTPGIFIDTDPIIGSTNLELYRARIDQKLSELQ